MAFADRTSIVIRSGRGGDGHVSFRREKYVPNGGPDGGDGGDGGDVIFIVDNGVHTLSDFRYRRKYSAGDGEEGGKKRCHGKRGRDLILKVPAGTVVKDAETGKVIVDMSGEHKEVKVLTGGKGGNGNMHYATSSMQAPKYAQPGEDATELPVILELKCIADVGLVGFPNAGKSTLISRVTNAKPEIADYPFTTLTPHLGVVDMPDGDGGFVMADIPGIIEGASEGVGLGFEFLKHIERCKVLIYIVDAAGTEGRDPVEDIRILNKELKSYGEDVADKPWIIAANKLDIIENTDNDVLKRLRAGFESEDTKVYPISAVTGEGVDRLLYAVKELLKPLEGETRVYEREFFPEDIKKETLPYTVEYDESEDYYVIEGPRIEKMLGYTNLESEKGFRFFQRFIKDIGAEEKLLSLGIEEGDTVKIYGYRFEYYK